LKYIHSSDISILDKTIAKGTTDQGVEFISQVLTQTLIKFHLQDIDQAPIKISTKHQQLQNTFNFKILTKPDFRPRYKFITSTNIQQSTSHTSFY